MGMVSLLATRDSAAVLTVACAAQSYQDALELAEKREAEVKKVFNKYDLDGSGGIDLEELTSMLEELGLLKNLQTPVEQFALQMFQEHDRNGDGMIECVPCPHRARR